MTVTLAFAQTLVVLAVGLALLVKGAGVAVDRLVSLARRFGVSDDLVGMTVVALGTSLPELASHVVASVGIVSGTLDYEVTSATVLGGNMGSSTLQQFLLVGVLLLGYGRYRPTLTFLRTSYVPMLVAFAVTLALGWDGSVTRLDGLVLLVVYVGYLVAGVRARDRSHPLPSTDGDATVRRDALVAALGLVGVLVGATVILRTTEVLIATLRLGGSMVGVITLGVAAAIPEFATVVESIRRRTPALALGTLVGSNVVNPLVGIGLGAVISTYAVPYPVLVWDLPVKLLVGVGLLAVAWLFRERQLTRSEGFALVVCYFGYLTGRLLLFPGQ